MEKDPKRFIYYSGSLFLLMAMVVMIWQMTGPTWFKNIKAEITSQPYARTVTVSADGKVNVKPDIAQIQLSVVSKGLTVKQITADNNQKMNGIIGAMKKLGVEDKDILTSQYDLNPDYDYTTGGRKFLGYNLTQAITVKVRKLESVDDVLDSAVKAGANEVGGLSFDIDDTGPIKKQAREKAFTMAKEKAAEMASAAGVRLGRVVTFSESTDSGVIPYRNFTMDAKVGAAESSSAPSIQSGSKEMTVSVSVTYEIE
ncbi:MAG: SIMPL domain-containing protein [Candidatus Gracilibacteria bacterium]|jgi:hypothetical protein